MDNNYGYDFPLSDFQKISIGAILSGKHSLITAATGSGKSLPAEFCINNFHKRTRDQGVPFKTIYTSPIKALSNQKYYDFQKKFPDIFFGLITGDIKCGPNADCLIMTCEILRNNLNSDPNRNSIPDFEMDLENELGLVIFDEVHYINDTDRGTVWEETIIKLSELSRKRTVPIQFLMLSATIEGPQNFANWITSLSGIEVVISGTVSRVVPLRHYAFLGGIPNHDVKGILDQQNKKFVEDVLREPLVLKDENVSFYDKNYDSLYKFFKIIPKDNRRIADHYTINQIVKYLHKESLTPAIFFTLSRKNVVNYALKVEISLHEDVPLNVRQDAQFIMKRLPNYKEYSLLPEYEILLGLLEKGIAYHHSGMLSIFRELVELMFEKGHVKLLFATETFSVGINLPTKAVVFDNLSKFDGNERRLLLSHEYTQMSGRAGRRGIDKIGYVFHLNNCFELIERNEYKEILSGNPQRFTSKFRIDESLVLRTGNTICVSEKSTLSISIENEKKELMKIISSEEIPSDFSEEISKFIELNRSLENNRSQNKKRSIQKEIDNLLKKDPSLVQKYKTYQNFLEKKETIRIANLKYVQLQNYYKNEVDKINNKLIEYGFLNEDLERAHEMAHEKVPGLTQKGQIASRIQEVNPLILTDILIETNYFNDYDIIDIISILSILFEPLDESSTDFPFKNLKTIIEELYNKYSKYDTNPSFCNYYSVKEWTLATTNEECLVVLNSLEVGTFTKLLLKLNNLVNELNKIPEGIIPTEFLHKLSKVNKITLKFMITNQSLYL